MVSTEIKLSEDLKKMLRSNAMRSQGVRLSFRKALRLASEYAKDHHRFESDTNKLENSIESRLIADYPLEGEIRVPDSVKYGIFVHEGTRPHKIFPKFKKALRWNNAGSNRFVFAKAINHPGAKPDPFLINAVDKTIDQGIDLIESAILAEMGGAD